ncbi:HGL118Wp [Eremothecium sinecaudum]|uniref:HGL118Wp n=1 Tax=Eremothecium sinecaudum TaxID=45286 RepID=A0A0X8HVD4_9SACH|nr:HGL118Wp [Eremothecium sinecaudum]AMD22222.1 HGL118Wp [Eremothecium sinecaudum]
MSLGITLSQLVQESSEPLATGIPMLDEAICGGLQPRSIYEIFGPPGVGKTHLGLQIIRNNSDKRTLLIDTHKLTPLYLLDSLSTLHTVRIRKFTQLVYFFQVLSQPYDLIIIEGLSQLLIDYLHASMKYKSRNVDASLHAFKNRSLILLMSQLTKYANQHNSCIVMLNDSMNTAYQDYSDVPLISFDGSENSSFLLKSEPKQNVQKLKSALVANASVGGKDSRWEVFIRLRIGLFWDWERDLSTKGSSLKVPRKTRIAIFIPLSTNSSSSGSVQVPEVVRLPNEPNEWVNTAINNMRRKSATEEESYIRDGIKDLEERQSEHVKKFPLSDYDIDQQQTKRPRLSAYSETNLDGEVLVVYDSEG